MISPHGSPPPADPVEFSPAPPRRAAWWCWPLILFALFPYHWLAEGPGHDDAGGSEAPVHRAGDLAILKMQGQVVIATFALNPAAATEALDDLSSLARDDHAVAALALLECFVRPDSPRIRLLLQRFSEQVPDSLAAATTTAVTEGVDEVQRGELRTHLGWFADLARAPGLAEAPREEAIQARALVVLAAMGLIFTAGLLGILVGGVLLFLHLRRLREGKSTNAFVAEGGAGGVLLECFALYLGIMTAGALLGMYLHGSFSLIGYGMAVVVPLCWPRFRGMRWRDFLAAIGLHRGKGWGREIGAGVVGYLGVLAIASIGISLTLLLTLVAGYFQDGGGFLAPGGGDGGGAESGGGTAPVGPEAHPIVGWMYHGTFWTKLACLGLAAGFAPLFEEIFFRGALQRYFRGRFRFFAAALFTSVIFAALHPQGFFAIPALAGIGIGFSLLREWRDSLIAPMVAHAINNGFLVLMLWWLL